MNFVFLGDESNFCFWFWNKYPKGGLWKKTRPMNQTANLDFKIVDQKKGGQSVIYQHRFRKCKMLTPGVQKTWKTKLGTLVTQLETLTASCPVSLKSRFWAIFGIFDFGPTSSQHFWYHKQIKIPTFFCFQKIQPKPVILHHIRPSNSQ